ncbi:hypothetical protein [Citricoccus muralis]|uniref:Pyrroloquinoline-quinone binding quinoprotein n=1 Tax=Citricoccus muralis TaxID=169134 RepID=A0ABY8H6L6_9MICC|nr:hypothetical protein [Citricoccus muralis]WFP16292.1 hypothetical protein P8192_13025 [Citricoccus muralis]
MIPRQSVLSDSRAAALFGILVLGLGACSAPSDQDPSGAAETSPTVSIDSEPAQVQTPAEEADLDAIHLPTHLTHLISVDPHWDTPPQVHDDVFLAPGEQDGKLVFSAVDADGTVLWTAERPLSCSGFALSSADGRPVAVLTDLSEPGESGDSNSEEDAGPAGAPLGTTTATAYDLHTGEQVWGPVEVPGPHQGPGLVFAERSDEPLGETGQRVALDASTGERRHEGEHVIGEYFGTTVITDEGDLIASASGSSEDQWSTQAPSATTADDAAALVSPATNRLPPGKALIGSPDGGYDLWDLTSGQTLAEEVDDAMFDVMSQTWVAVREDELTGLDVDGEELWSIDATDAPRLLGVGGVMAYVLTDEENLEIYNVVTGNTARVYDPLEEGATAIPLAFTESGATAIDTGNELLLVTDVPRPAENDAD